MDKHGVARKLLRLNEQLEEKKTERSEFQGEYNSLVHRLKTEFSLSEVDKIQERLKDLDEDLYALDESMDQHLQKVEVLFEQGEA